MKARKKLNDTTVVANNRYFPNSSSYIRYLIRMYSILCIQPCKVLLHHTCGWCKTQTFKLT